MPGGWQFAIAPFAGWLVAGTLKFAINFSRRGREAWGMIGSGHLPSTHTTVVATTAALVGFRAGVATPEFAVAATLAWIVVIDALSLRRQAGRHAAALNRLLEGDPEWRPLRERLGHRPIEIAAGLLLGVLCGYALHRAT